MSKLLDLRDKSFDKVKVVEHIIFKPRSFKVEMIKMLSIITVVSILGWGISHADNLNPFSDTGIETATQNFSALGNVSEITESSITLIDAKGSDKSGNTTYTLNISHLEKVETSAYTPLIITDIKVGDKIIAQGLTDGTTFFIKRIVSFSSDVKPLEVATTTVDVATSTASTTTDTASTTTDTASSTNETSSNESSTTTPEVIIATTTEVATTTETSTTTEEATTTPTIIETVGGVVQDVIDAVTNVVQTVVDTVTGNTEPDPVPPPVEETPTPEPASEPAANPEPVI